MQVNIITSQKAKPNFIVSFTHLVYWNMMYFLKENSEIEFLKFLRKDYILYILIIINLIFLLHYTVNCLIQISNKLGIKIFTIPYKNTETINSKLDKAKED